MKNRSVLLKLLGLILLLALAAAIPFAGAGLVYTLQDNAYEDTYYAELPRKVERLENTPGRRVVVIGGSSVAFGIDSALFEEETGLTCVNFGLYAAFGLKPMLDLSLPALHRGDIVVIAPETSRQMYSAYCGYDYLLQAFETCPARLLGLGIEYWPGLALKVPGYAGDAKRLRERGGAQNAGVYALSSFNERGDISYPRPENVMEQGYIEDNLPETDRAIVTREFLDMINDYTRAARRRGAEVYFSYCPIDALSLRDSDEARREDFAQALREGLECPILSPLDDHIMDAGFFYDSNYHLNDTGVRYNTLLLAGDVLRVLGSVDRETAALPHAPVLQRDNAVLSSGAQNGILYDVTARGAIVTGLDDGGRAAQVLDISSRFGDADVISVASGAFGGCAAEEIVLPDTIARLPGRLFAGADRLRRVTLLAKALPEVGDELLAGAAPGLALFVPEALYGSYITDYFWGVYSGALNPVG